MTRAYGPLLADLGVTYPQYLVLLALWEEDDLPIHRLASVLELEPATVTPIVKRLEGLGLVSRSRSSDDERRVHVSLTDRGAGAKREALGIPEQLGCALGIDGPAARGLIGQLAAIRANIHESIAADD